MQSLHICRNFIQTETISAVFKGDCVIKLPLCTFSCIPVWGQLPGSSMKPRFEDPPVMTTPGLAWKATVRLLPFLTEKLVLPAHRSTLLVPSDGRIKIEVPFSMVYCDTSANCNRPLTVLLLVDMTLHCERRLHRARWVVSFLWMQLAYHIAGLGARQKSRCISASPLKQCTYPAQESD